MTRGTTISMDDIVPRHLRTSSEGPSSVVLTPGATLADARRQLVLRTFSMTGGDVERTARMVGMTEPEVRSELTALVGGNGGAREPDGVAARHVKSSTPVKERAAARAKTKGRR
jgi:hypothetical protein